MPGRVSGQCDGRNGVTLDVQRNRAGKILMLRRTARRNIGGTDARVPTSMRRPARRRRPRSPVAQVVAKRLFFGLLLLFLVSVLSFVLVSLTPGDAAQAILGPYAPPETYARLRQSLGLDLPLYEQYWRWLTNALHGDFGRSLITSEEST